jgi:hypothetical protein
VSVVKLTRAALITSDPSQRRPLLTELSQREGIAFVSADERQPPELRIERPAMIIIEDEMRRQLGPHTRAVRLENTRSNLSGSSGLGLAIVDRIARTHDGRLHLLARTGDGLEARVELVGGTR